MRGPRSRVPVDYFGIPAPTFLVCRNPERCQMSKMEYFTKNVKKFQLHRRCFARVLIKTHETVRLVLGKKVAR